MKEKIIEFIFRHALIDLIWAISFCFVYTLGMYIGSVRYGLGMNFSEIIFTMFNFTITYFIFATSISLVQFWHRLKR
jgi:hypothetical protein